MIVPEGFDRIFLHAAGANDTFTSDDIDYDIVKRARVFHMGYPTTMKKMYENDGEELIRTYRRVKELGVTTSLDMSLPDPNAENGKMDWDSVLKRLLPYVDIYLPSAEETMYMIARGEFNRLKKLRAHMICSRIWISTSSAISDSSFFPMERRSSP